MRFLVTVLLPASLLACTMPQPVATGEQRILLDTVAGLARFKQQEEDLNRVYACGLAPYPEIAGMERKVRGYAEANTPRTSPAELHAQALQVARDFARPSAAGCVNAKAQWATLRRVHAATEPTQANMATPIPPSAGMAATPVASAPPGQFREFEADTILVAQGVGCRLVDVRPATLLVGRMADYWHAQAPATSRDAFLQRASDIVSNLYATPRPDCSIVQARLFELLGRYRARLIGERRSQPRPPVPQPVPRFRFKEPEAAPHAPAPDGGRTLGPAEVEDL